MSDPMSAVQEYVAAFNRGDSMAMAAAFATPATILDGIAPHVWHGSTAAQDWYSALLAEGNHLGASEYVVTLGEPRHVDVAGDAAYVVAPASISLKLRGEPMTQSGATMTIALRNVPQGWRITAWAWAKGNQPSQP